MPNGKIDCPTLLPQLNFNVHPHLTRRSVPIPDSDHAKSLRRCMQIANLDPVLSFSYLYTYYKLHLLVYYFKY